MVRPLAFITAAWSDNSYEAKEEAAKYSRQIYDAGFSPIVCGNETDEQVKMDIAMAKRYRIVTTTLDGILTIEGKCKKKE